MREGKSRNQAIFDAGQVRLRPILMTTLAMVFGMLPMSLGLGDGGETQAPMGRAIIGGVMTSTLLTLVVVPVLYTYLDAWGVKAKAWFPAARMGRPRLRTRHTQRVRRTARRRETSNTWREPRRG